MGIEQVIQRVQSDKQLRESVRRWFMSLSKASRAEVLAEFAEVVMADEAASNEPPRAPRRQADDVLARAGKTKQTKTDQAEELVKARPGITTKEVAARIDQSPRTAGSTLAQLAANRGSIKSKNGGWYPVASKASKATEGTGGTVRDLIVEVMSDGAPRGTGDIIKSVIARHPGTNKNSINAGVHRMATMDPPMLIKRGEGEHGPLYVLASAETEEELEFGSPAP